MKRKALLTLCLLAAATIGIWAQAPNNTGTYYRNANGKKGAALKTAMHDIISQKKKTPSYSDLWSLYRITDKRADGKVRDWYSNITNYTFGTDQGGTYKKEGDCYNREHTVPQSWFGEASPMKSDIVHVVPTDGYVNNMRGNLPLGEVGTVSSQSTNGYSKVGTSKTPGYSGKVFEPNDEIKGDLARIYFYMATCYEGQAEDWGGVFGGTKYQPLVQWTYDMLVRWSQLDPVDDVELARNEAVYRADVQGNRNPFVDYPGLEDYIWGSKKDVAFSYDHYEGGEVVIVVPERVKQPMFSPAGGSFEDQVTVTITTATEGATIYYTTNGTDPSANSNLYEAPITLTASTTLKAIAMKEGMEASDVTTANYVITAGGEQPPVPMECTIALNNALFGTSFNGSVSGSDLNNVYTGTIDGITISYAKGTGSNMYISNNQLRLYPGNTLTITSAGAPLTSMEFTVDGNKGSKVLQANTGIVSANNWTGNAQSVSFSVNSGSGNLQISKVKVATASFEPSKDGDMTGDGVLDNADLSALVQSICGGVNNPQADINNDGRVDIGDLMTLIQKMMGMQR